MSWFNRIGKAITGGVQKLGHKVSQGVDAATRLMDHAGHTISKVAGKVGNVAGTVASVAGTAAPALAAIPVVGDAAAIGAGAVAGLAKGVQAGAAAAGRAGAFVDKAGKTVRQIQSDAKQVVGMGKDFAANPNTAAAVRYAGQAGDMVRNNRANIDAAAKQFRRIANPKG